MKTNPNFNEELQQLRNHGYFLSKGFANHEECEDISETLKMKSINISNCNELSATKVGSTIFNKHSIAISKAAFDTVTYSPLLEISEKYIGAFPILKCSRSYAISKSDPCFEWHSDNKDPNNVVDNSKGIVFILFLEDDIEGTFSLIKDTNNFSKSLNSLPSLKEIKFWKKNNMIKKFYPKKGDLLGFSQDIFHRHITETKHSLNAFWFQVIGENAGIGERVLINPSFLKEKNQDRLLKYFSSNNERINISFPVSSINSISFSSNLKYIIILLLKLPNSFFTSLRMFIMKLLSFSILSKIKIFFK